MRPPRISAIIPVYRVQDFLPECLESVLGDRTPEIEVIALDDRSPDGCGEILDAYAAEDARLRVVHLDRNVGLGRSRDMGLAHARGTYVWFLAARRLPRRAVAGVGRLLYSLFTLLPLRRDLVVYAAYWYGDYACNPRAIFERAQEIAPHLRGVWGSSGRTGPRGCLRGWSASRRVRGSTS